MTIPQASVFYSQSYGSVPERIEIPIYTNRNPTPYDVKYPQGKRWINQLLNIEYVLTGFYTTPGYLCATWTSLQPESSATNQISSLVTNVGSSPVTPINGAISIFGDNLNVAVIGETAALVVTINTLLTLNKVSLVTAGGQISISDKNSATASCGNTTLVGGTSTVTTSACTSASEVFITPTVLQGNLGFVTVSSVANGSFTLTSENAGDTSSYNYLIIG